MNERRLNVIYETFLSLTQTVSRLAHYLIMPTVLRLILDSLKILAKFKKDIFYNNSKKLLLMKHY